MNLRQFNIFLDDERFPSDTDFKAYVIVRNYDDFVYHVTKFGIPNFISFDHDLGFTFTQTGIIWDQKIGKTGYDCAKWLIDFMMNNRLEQSVNFVVHSQNPVGKVNIEMLLNNWNKAQKT